MDTSCDFVSPIPPSAGPIPEDRTPRFAASVKYAVAWTLFCLLHLSSFAATRTWSGGGGDDNWTTAANWGGTAPVAGDDLVFAGTTRLTPNNNFAAGTNFASITFSVGAGAFVIGGNAFNLTGGATALTSSITTGIVTINNNITFTTAAPTATVAAGGVLSLGGVLGGTLGLTKAGAGQLTLGGTVANNYTGVTTVSAGRLHLNKTAAIVAIPGNLTITGGQVSIGPAGTTNQIADTCAVTMSGASSVFNGTGINTGVQNVTETIASVTVTGGCFNAGGTSVWTITGAFSFTGGAGNTIFVGNSGSQLTCGSLNLTDMTATAGGTVGTNNSFTLYGNTMAQSSITTSALTLNNSRLNLRRGGAGMLGSRLILNGNVTTVGTAACFVTEDAAGGTAGAIAVELSSGTAAVTRTMTVGAGGADLTIGIPITNGTSTAGSITKAGAGTLNLNGANTYTGTTTINAGTIQAGIITVAGTSGALGVNSPVVLANAAGAMLNITGFNTQIGSLTGGGGTGGNVTLGAAVLTVGADNTSPAAYGGAIGGTGSVTKIGTGTLTLSGASGYSGGTSVNGGALSVTNTVGSATGTGAVVIAAAASLTGTGTISGTVNVDGTVAPGLTGVGTLTLSGNVSFNNGSALTVQINGASADQLAVGGTLALNATTALNVSATGTSQGQVFTLVNKGAGAVTGTFAGVTEGATLLTSNRPFLATYLGGDGNDVVFTDDGPDFTAAVANTLQSIDEAAGLASLAATVPGGRPLTFTIQSGVLPSVITLNTDGTFSGLADSSSAGSYLVVLRVTDDRGAFDETTLAINVADAGLSVTAATVNESAGTVTITVTRTGSLGAVSVQADTLDAMALAGRDYTTTSAVLNWANAETGPKTFTVPIVNDGIAEITETFLIVLSNPVNTSINNGTAAISILDDDAPAAVADTAVAGQGAARVINVLANDLRLDNTPIQVSIVTAPTNGSATANADGTVTFVSSVTGSDSFVYQFIDALGLVAQATVTVSVTPAPTFTSLPTVVPNPVIVGTPVSGAVQSDFGTITWDWGDGTVSVGSSVAHLYAAPGAYTVVVSAVSSDGGTTVRTVDVFVSFGLSSGGGTGATPPGITGILVGGSGAGAAQGGSGKIVCNYVRRDKTTYQGAIGSLNLPATLTQESLAMQVGTLRVGSGANVSTFRFDLNKRGRGRATGVPLIDFNVAKKRFKFKIQRGDLTALTEVLGGTREFINAGQPVTLSIPVTLQIGDKVFLALTFQVKYSQIGNSGKGRL